MTPCLLVGNLSADVSEVALRDAFQAHRAISALVVAAPAAADVTHGFVWLDACAAWIFCRRHLYYRKCSRQMRPGVCEVRPLSVRVTWSYPQLH